MATPDAPRMSSQELHTRIEHGEPVIVLDVRTEAALNMHPYKIPGARWMSLASVVEQAQQLPRRGTVVAYCT